jgi:DNA polymerase-3 subunit delta
VEDVLNAKRYPMMADRQVVIVKKSRVSLFIDKTEVMSRIRQPTTVLVLPTKYKTLDKRKKPNFL